MRKICKKEYGITLVALVITLVVLLILAGITIGGITNVGLLKKADFAKEETTKNNAVEIMNFKITNIQISSYAEGQKLPTLQYVSDKLCEDNDVEYVLLESKKQASLDKIKVTEGNSIYTKLKDYPYEFEINSNLQLASINGVKVSYNNGENNISNSDVFETIDFEVKEDIGIKVNINPIFKDGKSKDDEYLYILIVDGNCVNYSENYELVYNNANVNSTYKISVLAIDRKGNSYKTNSKEFKTSDYTYTKKLLEYPMITANGICNIKVECKQDDSKSYYIFDKSMGNTTNPNSMPIEAYDGDLNTYAGPYNIVSKYLSIDPSIEGKKITIKTNGKYTSYSLVKYLSYESFFYYGDTRATTYTCTIPSGASKYLYICYGNEDACFYEITIDN